MDSGCSLFELEDAFAGEGWHGLSNMGEHGIQRVIAACEELKLQKRANALRRVLVVFRANPGDEDALAAAAGDYLPDLIDDDASFQIIASYVRTNPDQRFGALPGDA
jgi:hypothetical protein